MSEKVELEILGITTTEQAKPSYVLILKEKNGNKRLPIVIGMFEAQSIAVKIDNLPLRRPITHDLIVNIFNALKINLIEVVITKIVEDIFYAELIIEHRGEIYRIDSRPSDAIAIAVRAGVPIYAYREVIEEAGLDVEKLYQQQKEYDQQRRQAKKTTTPPPSTSTQQSSDDYLKTLSDEKLEQLMKKAIEEENYELASKIRDELKRRRGEL